MYWTSVTFQDVRSDKLWKKFSIFVLIYHKKLLFYCRVQFKEKILGSYVSTNTLSFTTHAEI